MRDQLLVARVGGKGNITSTGEAIATANNVVTIPPGVYDVEVTRGAITGTVTQFGVAVREYGKLVNNPAADSGNITTWQALRDPRGGNLDVANLVSGRQFFRGVVIRRWNDGGVAAGGNTVAGNAGVDITLTGTGNIANCEVTFWPDGRAPQYNGLP